MIEVTATTTIGEQAVGDRRLTAALLRSVSSIRTIALSQTRGLVFARLH